MGGDFNIKSSENDGTDLEALEEILEEYNVTLQSDKNEPTCFNNNNRGSSTVDYVFCSNNFPQISKIDYYRLHAGSDHSAIRISFKLPRYILSKKRKEILMETDVNLDLARQSLRTLNENIDKHKEHEVADRLWETLCDSKSQTRQKKKARKYQ